MKCGKMQRRPVNSSNLASVGFDSESETLEVEFNDGSVYQYFGVPVDVYRGLMSAGSHGSYFHQHIRNVYQYTRIV
jgi:hypothetical protein